MIKNKLKYCVLFLLVAIGFSSCLKDTAFLDVSNTQPIAEFSFGSNGTKSASWGTLADTTVVDTAIAVDIASPQVLNYDVTITLKFDTTLIAKFNTANPTNLLKKLPDSCFSGPTSPFTITIPAGYRIGKFKLKLFPKKIDPTVSYAMPYSIVSATGSGGNLLLGSNSSSLIYGFIGNPIAGNYIWDFTRYSAPSNAGSPDGTSFTGEATVFVPITPTQVEVASGYYIGPRYEISFTNTGGVITNPQVILNADDVATMTSAGITVTTGPVIDKFDPINKSFIFHYVTLTRYVIDAYHK